MVHRQNVVMFGTLLHEMGESMLAFMEEAQDNLGLSRDKPVPVDYEFFAQEVVERHRGDLVTNLDGRTPKEIPEPVLLRALVENFDSMFDVERQNRLI
jgi:hypothetical protein